MEHAIAKFLAQSASDAEVAEKLDAVWTVCLGKDHLELWDKRLAQAFAQLELPIEWTLVGDILQKGNLFLNSYNGWRKKCSPLSLVVIKKLKKPSLLNAVMSNLNFDICLKHL